MLIISGVSRVSSPNMGLRVPQSSEELDHVICIKILAKNLLSHFPLHFPGQIKINNVLKTLPLQLVAVPININEPVFNLSFVIIV